MHKLWVGLFWFERDETQTAIFGISIWTAKCCYERWERPPPPNLLDFVWCAAFIKEKAEKLTLTKFLKFYFNKTHTDREKERRNKVFFFNFLFHSECMSNNPIWKLTFWWIRNFIHRNVTTGRKCRKAEVGLARNQAILIWNVKRARIKQ